MSYTAAQLIELLHLLPHPEGGWYAFRESSGQVLPALPGFPGHRESCSYIYYLSSEAKSPAGISSRPPRFGPGTRAVAWR